MTHSSDSSACINGTIMDNFENIIDSELLALAESRLANYSPENNIPWEDVLRESGLTEEDLADFDEVEIE